MFSTQTIQQLTAISVIDTADNKNSIEDHIQYFLKLTYNLACSENIYHQHLHNLKFGDLIETSDDERELLYELVRVNRLSALAQSVDSVIDTKSNQISLLIDSIHKLNQAIISNTLPMTEKLAAFSSSLQVVKQLNIYIQRINAILDFMPQAVFADKKQKYPGIEKARTEAGSVYELLKMNRKILNAYFSSTGKNNLMCSKPIKEETVANPRLTVPDRCHV